MRTSSFGRIPRNRETRNRLPLNERERERGGVKKERNRDKKRNRQTEKQRETEKHTEKRETHREKKTEKDREKRRERQNQLWMCDGKAGKDRI